MSIEKLSFGNYIGGLKGFFDSENVILPPNLYNDLLYFLSKACTYEEEEKKIRPSILISSELDENYFIKITQATLIPLIKEPINDTHLSKRLKSILPFCNNGWRVYININNEQIIYGIVRNFNGPSGINIEDILLTLSDEETSELQMNYVLIDVESNFDIVLRSNNRQYKIDFRLIEGQEIGNTNPLFCQDLLSSYENGDPKAYTAYSKLIKLFSQKLHGSICVIIKYDHELPDEILSDGIFLDVPIDIYSVLTEELGEKHSSDVSYAIFAHEKYHAYSGLLFEMLNIDGITVLDNKGRIRAYNVFVKPDTSGNEALAGGARKRAATYLQRQSNPDYIGVYFQSQDGMSSYERIGSHE